jgi:RNA polymerase primary sigma factor
MALRLSSGRPRVPTGGGCFDQYLAEIGAIPQLTANEERALAVRAHRGDEAAQHALARHNVQFVVAMAKRLRGHGLGLEDLVAEGNVGLMTAARRFDPNRGVKFISYAVWWVRQAMLSALTRQGHAVHVPLSQSGTVTKVSRQRYRLRQELMREPAAVEIADAAGMTQDAVERIVGLMRPAQLDRPVGDGGTTLGDLLPGERATQSELEDRILNPIAVATLLLRLPAREALVIRRSFGLDGEPEQTLEEIGAALGITRQRAQQLRERALERMREAGGGRPKEKRRWTAAGRVAYQRRGSATRSHGAVADAAAGSGAARPRAARSYRKRTPATA